MNLDAWLPAFHVVGAILWVGGLTAVLALLTIHPRVDESARATLTTVEKRLALVMEIGSAIAIGVGLWIALRHVPNEFRHGGWLHIKLTAVVFCILSVHGIARAKLKKFSRGDLRPLPPVVWLLLLVGVTVAATFGANHGLMRG